MQKRKQTNTRLDLRIMLQNNQPVWVRNNSVEIAKKMGKRPGMIVLQVKTDAGIDPLYVPAGPDPVCLTDMAGSESLLQCADLYKLLNKKALLLLDPDESEQYYVQNEARRELIDNKIDSVRNHIPLEKSEVAPVKITQSSIDPYVPDVCLKLKHGVIEAPVVMESLLEREGMFTHEEFQYLALNCSNKEIKKWAMERME